MILKYGEFLTENNVYDLILESKIVYSQKFINILTKMKSNKIAIKLLDLYSKDVDVQHNYIDITDQKDAVSFTPDRKVKELSNDKEETYKVIQSGLYLTHGSSNDSIFRRLGYTKEGRENWAPSNGTIVKILSETISRSTGKTYVMVQEFNGERVGVVNKLALRASNEDEDSRVWNISRNNIKIGRLVRSILTASGISFIDRDIEEFTNQYKATFDFINDALNRFDVVTGDKISFWYDHNNYSEEEGTLGSSCMMYKPSDFFDIYTLNQSKVSLVILYDDDGKLEDGRYKSNHIKGRALLWNCDADGEPIIFMDRIYTINDSDVELFKQFAEKNKYWYKTSQNSEHEFMMSNGSENKRPTITVKLESSDFNQYPYLDSLCYLNIESNLISNNQSHIDAQRELNDTGGGYDEVGSYGDDDYGDDD